MFNKFSNDLRDKPVCVLRKFADDTKLGGISDLSGRYTDVSRGT